VREGDGVTADGVALPVLSIVYGELELEVYGELER
jgi:hypothetical protein